MTAVLKGQILVPQCHIIIIIKIILQKLVFPERQKTVNEKLATYFATKFRMPGRTWYEATRG